MVQTTYVNLQAGPCDFCQRIQDCTMVRGPNMPPIKGCARCLSLIAETSSRILERRGFVDRSNDGPFSISLALGDEYEPDAINPRERR